MFKRTIYSALLVMLGVVLGTALQPFSYLQTFAQPGCQTFKETGKTVCGRFLDYWQKNGGLAQQGFPLSNEFTEMNDLDGKTYLVQYFERAVFEYHPEIRDPKYQVLLSQLGAFQFKRKYPNGEPVGQPTPSIETRMTIETAKGRVVLKLYTEPGAGVSKTIANFTTKANSGYFDGLTFHRVEDWVVQGGDPMGTGTGGGNMPSEYNQIPFTAGSLGVVRGGDPAINNDSQFFILKADTFLLNGQYTNFGQVVEGMDVVNRLSIGDKMTKVRVEGMPAMQEPDRVTVQHILIGFKDAVGFQGNAAPERAKARTQEQARTLAYDLLTRTKGGENFNKLVTDFSDDSYPGIYSMANTGVTPVGDEFKRIGIVQAFGDLSFRLKIDEIGITDYDPQASPFGYHIIKRLK
jgi:cyclophilin family peptidyl-prolyl cis-trans isomerase